jgi:cytochrome c oxidase subunit 3
MTALSGSEKSHINRVHPQLFALWVGIVAIIMMFVALTSAYIVRKSAGNWLEFNLPTSFYISTAFILGSSVVFQLSLNAYKAWNARLFNAFLFLGILLGIGFIVFQYFGWSYLYNIGISHRENVSSSFLFLITWLHAAHVLGGIVALIMLAVSINIKPFLVTPKRLLRIKMVFVYWHFVDILWLYLLLFLITQH